MQLSLLLKLYELHVAAASIEPRSNHHNILSAGARALIRDHSGLQWHHGPPAKVCNKFLIILTGSRKKLALLNRRRLLRTLCRRCRHICDLFLIETGTHLLLLRVLAVVSSGSSSSTGRHGLLLSDAHEVEAVTDEGDHVCPVIHGF